MLPGDSFLTCQRRAFLLLHPPLPPPFYSIPWDQVPPHFSRTTHSPTRTSPGRAARPERTGVFSGSLSLFFIPSLAGCGHVEQWVLLTECFQKGRRWAKPYILFYSYYKRYMPTDIEAG